LVRLAGQADGHTDAEYLASRIEADQLGVSFATRVDGRNVLALGS